MAHRHDGPPAPLPTRSPSGLETDLGAVLVAYLGDRLAGRTVALIGSATGTLAGRIAEASGRRVFVFDPDRGRTADAIARARGARAQVRYEILGREQPAADARFDAVILPDLAALVASGTFDAKGAVTLAERILAPEGFVAVATPHGDDAVDYPALFDAVSARFAVVHMLGAAPFAGVTVAAFGNSEEPAVAIDSSLAERPAGPVAYLAIGSRLPTAIDPYLLVQLPSAEPAEPASAEAAARRVQGLDFQVGELRATLADARRELDALRVRAARADQLEGECARLARDLAANEQAARRASVDETTGEAAAEIAALEARLRERGDRVKQLEADAREAERLGRDLVRDLEAARAATAPPPSGGSALELAARCSHLEADLQQARWRIESLERELGERPQAPADVARLEAALRATEEALRNARSSAAT